MSRGAQIGLLCVSLGAFLFAIALLPATPPPAASTPAPTKPASPVPTTAGAGVQIATAVGNASLATAIAGVDRSRLSTTVAGIDRNQAATAVAITGLLQPGACLNIKGVVMPNGVKTYYLPESYFYEGAVIDTAKGDRFFCSAAEALTAGFTPGQ